MAGMGSTSSQGTGPRLPGYEAYKNADGSASSVKGIGQVAYAPPPKAPIAPPSSPAAATASASAPASVPRFDLGGILKTFGAGTPQASAPMTNTSSPNPTISEINRLQLERAKGDMNVGNLGRASDIAIRDNAENERKAARQNAASRGVSGGGIEDLQQGAISRDTLRRQTGARVDIANDGEARRDNLYGQIAGQAAMEENLQGAQRAEARNLQSLAYQQQQAARTNELSLIRSVLDLFGEEDLFGVMA